MYASSALPCHNSEWFGRTSALLITSLSRYDMDVADDAISSTRSTQKSSNCSFAERILRTETRPSARSILSKQLFKQTIMYTRSLCSFMYRLHRYASRVWSYIVLFIYYTRTNTCVPLSGTLRIYSIHGARALYIACGSSVSCQYFVFHISSAMHWLSAASYGYFSCSSPHFQR